MKLLGAVLDGESADLTALIEPKIDSASRRAARDRLVEVLLDRHGTGRILFRNTRNTVTGFPGREVIPTALDKPSEYREVLEVLGEGGLEEPDLLLYPELLFQAINDESPVDWAGIDPRPAYLLEKVTDLHPEKVLVITASANTAIDLAGFLKSRQGIDAAVFHEHMSLLERDRAAAWFADTNAGAQIMICSEIGSEGRNFQFAHHLVLFDLPLNPDLLEQRIGRLDRIGQTDTIRIHLCYIRDSAQEVMYQWYQQGLDALRNTCPTGYQVFGEVERDLVECLHRPGQDHSQLIEKTNRLHHELMAALEQGRDRLLEYNSYRPAIAADLQARAKQQDSGSGIQQYMEVVFDCFGVEYEIHSEGCFAINAGVHMALPFPSLPEDGMTVTYDRGTALVYEDVDYLTWDHPLVVGARDLVVTAEFGNTAVVAAPIPGVSRGTILLESIFLLEPASSEDLPASRYLPMTPFRVLIDQNGKRHDHNPSHRSTEDPGELLKPDMVKRIVKMKEKLLRNMVAASEKFANKLAPERLDSALNNATTAIEKEVDRLSALSRVNPNVREEEIDFYRMELSRVRKCIENTRVRLDALRVIIAT